jgi:gliding motility-associated-like protein
LKISAILQRPANFLKQIDSICTYEKLLLQPSGLYRDYLWSTGSTEKSINIQAPGIYWLKVGDANGCNGTDSISVFPKKCMEGFYIANAFTPNGDYKNDIMRPLLFGNVKSYRFTIYNRWGEIVFQTNELKRGWDGKFAGRLQQTCVFVWICNYQFEGGEDKTEKGTFTLIR